MLMHRYLISLLNNPDYLKELFIYSITFVERTFVVTDGHIFNFKTKSRELVWKLNYKIIAGMEVWHLWVSFPCFLHFSYLFLHSLQRKSKQWLMFHHLTAMRPFLPWLSLQVLLLALHLFRSVFWLVWLFVWTFSVLFGDKAKGLSEADVKTHIHRSHTHTLSHSTPK